MLLPLHKARMHPNALFVGAKHTNDVANAAYLFMIMIRREREKVSFARFIGTAIVTLAFALMIAKLWVSQPMNGQDGRTGS